MTWLVRSNARFFACGPAHQVFLLGAFLLGASVGCGRQSPDSREFPRRPIKLIVPFGAGGGSDTFGRIIQNAIEANQLLPERLVIINVPGAGGTIGSRRVKNARPDGYTLLLLHEGIMTARHCGSASYGPEAFTAIAGTGNATQVIAVAASSDHHDLTSLMNAAKRQPDSILFSANIGAPSHFAGLMLQSQQPGATFRYTQNGGGAKRFAALQGGHADVTAFSIAEYVQFRSSGIRALGLLGPDRHPELPQLATAREQGFDVISQNMQFWWAPAGTPGDRIEMIADALTAAMATDEVRKTLMEMKITDETIRGKLLESELETRNDRIAAVGTAAIVALPDFVALSILMVILLGLIALFQAMRVHAIRRRGQENTSNPNREPATPRSSLPNQQLGIAGVLTVLYVSLMQLGLIEFIPATACYAMFTGAVIVLPRIQTRRITLAKAGAALALVSVLMSVVIHYLFTQILVVDLP